MVGIVTFVGPISTLATYAALLILLRIGACTSFPAYSPASGFSRGPAETKAFPPDGADCNASLHVQAARALPAKPLDSRWAGVMDLVAIS